MGIWIYNLVDVFQTDKACVCIQESIKRHPAIHIRYTNCINTNAFSVFSSDLFTLPKKACLVDLNGLGVLRPSTKCNSKQTGLYELKS